MSRSRLNIMTLFTMLALLLAGCAPDQEPAAQGDATDEPTEAVTTEATTEAEETEAAATGCEDGQLTIAQGAGSYVYVPAYVADGAGFFEEEGLEPEYIDTRGANAIAALIAGDVDLAVSVTFSSLVAARAEGAPVSAVVPMTTENALDFVVKQDVLEQAGLTEESPVEEKLKLLKGRTIGIHSPGSGADHLVRVLMTEVGLNPDTDAQIVALGGDPERTAAFIQGQIDVVVQTPPASLITRQEGDGAWLLRQTKGEYEALSPFLFTVAATSETVLEERPETIECYVRAVDKALNLIQEDPEQAFEAAQPFLEDAIAENPELAREAFLDIVPAISPSDPEIRQDMVETVREFMNRAEGTTIDAETAQNAVAPVASE